MRKSTIFICVIIMMLTLPNVSMAQGTRAVLSQTWYGDNMGESSETTATKKVEYLYDAHNLLSRKLQTGLMTETNDWILTNYCRFDYNKQNQLVSTNSLQYGIYDLGAYAFRATNDTISYEYNEKGQVVRENDLAKKQYFLYEYDAEGRMVKNSRFRYDAYSTKTYNNDLTLEYSDFTVGGPQTVVATASASYNNYKGKITYDAAGNKTSEKHWDLSDALKQAEYWTYNEDGMLVTYEKKGISGGEEVNASKTEYEAIDANNIRSKSYSWANNKWGMKGGSTCVTTYFNLPATGQWAPVITAQQAKTTGTNVEVALTLPADKPASISSVNIFRNGLLLATKTIDELYDSESGKYIYLDENAPIGEFEYSVQAVSENAAERVLSNIAKAQVAYDLPCATNVRATSARKDTDGNYQVTIAWTNPEVPEGMTFESTSIMKVGTYYDSQMHEESITDASISSAVVSFGIDAEMKIYIRTNYNAGHAASSTITVDATKLIGKVSEENRKLRVIETYGDVLGETNSPKPTKKHVYYYGNDNRVQREAVYGKSTANDEYTIMTYTNYVYGENGQLEKVYSRQYGRYDYGDMGFRESTDTIHYEFNVEGQMVKEVNQYGDITDFEYGADGSLVKKTTVLNGTTPLTQTILYSDFVGKDKPRSTVSDGDLNSYKWTLETEYDSNSNKSSERKSTYSSYTGAYKPSTLEVWEYNDQGTLVGDTVFNIKISNDIENYEYKSYTSYEEDGGDPNRIKVYKRVWDNILKKFGNPSTYTVNVYSDINATKYSPVLEVVPVEGQVNTVSLNVTVPAAQQNAMTALNVYRNGIEIAHGISYFDTSHYLTDEYGMNGKWVLEDKNVKNGEYDYFVELAKFDATMTEEASAHNISNVITKQFNVDLPKATGLQETSRRETSVYNSEEGVYERNVFVTVGWEAPKDAETYGFKRYNVMLTGVQIAENDAEDGQALSYEVEMRGREKLGVYVQCVYEYGRCNSDTITICENVEDGIETPLADGTIVINNGTVTLSENANITVYGLNGALVARERNTRKLDLNATEHNTYLIVVEKNGRKSAVKYQK